MKTIIITGKRDTGKTTWCGRNLCSPEVSGVRLEKSYHPFGAFIGYDAVNVATKESIPLLRVKIQTDSGFPHVGSPGAADLRNRGELEETDALDVKLIRFMVSSRGMKKANRWIHDAWMEPGKKVLIDEVGRLELMGRGYAKSLHEIYRTFDGGPFQNTPSPSLTHQTDKTVFLVVREDFLSEVIACFRIGSIEAWVIEDGEITSSFSLP
jgi:nucleoside-triphosphatase THEP1